MCRKFFIVTSLLIICFVISSSVPGMATFSDTIQAQNFWQSFPIAQESFPSTKSLEFEVISSSTDSPYNIYKYRTYEKGYSIRVRDINSDGWDDLIFGTSSFHIRIWLQNPQCHQLQEWLILETEVMPIDLEIADLNDDGKLEIIALGVIFFSSEHPGYVQIFSPSQDGYTPVGDPYMLGKYPRKVKIGDVTGDNKPDILVTDDQGLEVLTQQPGGDFLRNSIPVQLIGSPNDLAIGDFNSDGYQDASIELSTSKYVLVFYQANGFLSPGTLLPWPQSAIFSASGMTSGDINGDSLIDLIVIVSSNTPYAKIIVYKQMANGNFDIPNVYDAYENPSSPNMGDMDNDGRLDLVVMNVGYGSFTIHYPSVSGDFGLNIIVPAGDVQALGMNMASLGDVTGDGKLDVVFLGSNDGIIIDARGDAPTCPVNVPPRAKMPFLLYGQIPNIDAREAVSADVNGDGLDEVLTLVSGTWDPSGISYVQVINQNVDGTFSLGNHISMGVHWPLSGISAGDINNDGRVDIAALRDYVYLAIQQNDGSFAPPVTFGNEIPNRMQTYIADWTGDGLNDLAVIGDNGINIYAQNNDGTLAEPKVYAQGELGGTYLTDITDWNGDGRIDIVAWWRPITQYSEKPVRVFLQMQDGSFEVLPKIRYDIPQNIVAGDINGDNRPDIVMSFMANPPEGRLGLIYQKPDGTMTESVILSDPLFNSPGSIVISDLNFDGLNDLFVFNVGCFLTSVFTQNQQHTFDSALFYRLCNENMEWGHSVAKIDIDKDKKPDVIVYVTNNNRILFIKPVPTRDVFLPIVKR